MDVQHIRMEDNTTTIFHSLFFATEFNLLEKKVWMEKNWTLSLYSVVAYVLFIFLGQEFMKNRKPMDLRKVMAVWNFFLAVFSISACTRIIPEFISLLTSPGGIHRSICGNINDVSPASMFWGWMFTLSKLMELGDTVFIILRKRTLIFLHWYHHITVLLYSWYSFSDMIAPARWFIVVNFTIHAMMYTYYGLRATGFWIPKPIAMTITMLQLSQMIIGVSINAYAYRMKTQNVDCEVANYHLQMGAIMYASYFILFAHFFYRAYFGRNARHFRQSLMNKNRDHYNDQSKTTLNNNTEKTPHNSCQSNGNSKISLGNSKTKVH